MSATPPGASTDPIPGSVASLPPAAGPQGQLAHPDAVKHLQRLRRQFYPVGHDAWCMVGNGLSNQTFIRGPEGIIAIDSGESVEEMREALSELRKHTQVPIVACIYTHFHYVHGTTAILEETANAALEIYGHAGISGNLARFGGEVAPRSTRGLVHQFGLMLPEQGADAMLHAGLGLFFRNPEHAPYTQGYIPARHTFDETTEYRIAGLDVVLMPAPSDASDSITIWFPALGTCVNNLLWPSLINIYAIRGEEFRDPRILLQGIDAMHALQPDHLIGTHGPPLSGAEIDAAITDYRDAIQFLWDQTVRGINQGLTLDEVTQRVQLPERFARSYFTRQFYGLAEHHVRQIHNGLFGWLDEDESHLFPLPAAERCQRLIAGFGGAHAVRAETDQALQRGDWRWAIETAGWLCRMPDALPADRQRLADALRGIAQHTPSANLRNYCLTRALEWEGSVDLSRFRGHRFRYDDVLKARPTYCVPILRVLLDPQRSLDTFDELAWHFSTGERAGLRLRGPVAVPTSGADSELSITLSPETWADVLANRTTFGAAENEGLISHRGDLARIKHLLSCFEHPSLN